MDRQGWTGVDRQGWTGWTGVTIGDKKVFGTEYFAKNFQFYMKKKNEDKQAFL